MSKQRYASLTWTKQLLAKLSFDPRSDPVHGQSLQASLSPDYHRDRAIVLIRGLNDAPTTLSDRVKAFKLIFVHLIWWHLRTPCSNTDDQKNAEPSDSAS